MRKLILIVMVAASLSAETAKTDLVVKPSGSDTVTVERAKPKRIHDYRYQIAGGVAMMLFFGLAIGTTQSMNPQ